MSSLHQIVSPFKLSRNEFYLSYQIFNEKFYRLYKFQKYIVFLLNDINKKKSLHYCIVGIHPLDKMRHYENKDTYWMTNSEGVKVQSVLYLLLHFKVITWLSHLRFFNVIDLVWDHPGRLHLRPTIAGYDPRLHYWAQLENVSFDTLDLFIISYYVDVNFKI